MHRALLALLAAAGLFAQKLPFDAQALLRFGAHRRSAGLARTAGWWLSKSQTIDVPNNKKITQIYVMPVAGGAARQITQVGQDNERPRWSPDSRRIAFVSDRGGIVADLADGSRTARTPRQVTNLSTEAGGVLFSPDGKNLVFTSDVFPQCGADDACNKKALDAEKNSKVKARIYTSLLYRHWNRWQGARRSHLAGGSGIGRRAEGPDARRSRMCRHSRWAAATITRFRRTAPRSATR